MAKKKLKEITIELDSDIYTMVKSVEKRTKIDLSTILRVLLAVSLYGKKMPKKKKK